MLRYTTFILSPLSLATMDLKKKNHPCTYLSSSRSSGVSAVHPTYRGNSCTHVPVGTTLASVTILDMYKKGVISLHHPLFKAFFLSLLFPWRLNSRYIDICVTSEKWAKGYLVLTNVPASSSETGWSYYGITIVGHRRLLSDTAVLDEAIL